VASAIRSWSPTRRLLSPTYRRPSRLLIPRCLMYSASPAILTTTTPTSSSCHNQPPSHTSYLDVRGVYLNPSNYQPSLCSSRALSFVYMSSEKPGRMIISMEGSTYTCFKEWSSKSNKRHRRYSTVPKAFWERLRFFFAYDGTPGLVYWNKGLSGGRGWRRDDVKSRWMADG